MAPFPGTIALEQQAYNSSFRRQVLYPCAVVVVVLVLAAVTGRTPSAGIAPQVAQVRGAVVHVEKTGECQGSGCLITSDGILFTAKHVSDSRPGKYTVTLDDGRKYPVKYVVEDRENDVSLMKLDLPPGVTVPYAQLAREDDMRVGDALFIFGSPLGRDNINTVSLGILSAAQRDLAGRRGWGEYRRYGWHVMLQSTSPAFPGNSGGPVFNMRGEVIGVLVAGQAETLNFSVPVARFRDTIETARQWFDLSRLNVIPDPPEPIPGPPARDERGRLR
jgi:S1-C subfamily serine protease